MTTITICREKAEELLYQIENYVRLDNFTPEEYQNLTALLRELGRLIEKAPVQDNKLPRIRMGRG